MDPSRRFEFLVPLPPEQRRGRFQGKTALRVVRIAATAAEAAAELTRDYGLSRVEV